MDDNRRYVILHSDNPVLDLRKPLGGAHVFGPFESFGEAELFNAAGDDDCYKVALSIAGPDPRDVLSDQPVH